jgi:hypothetical protein
MPTAARPLVGAQPSAIRGSAAAAPEDYLVDDLVDVLLDNQLPLGTEDRAIGRRRTPDTIFKQHSRNL